MQDKTDTPSFDDIYRDYAGKILNLAYRLTANEDTARDLTQEVFIKVYQSLAKFEHRSQIYTWIYRIAVNHIMTYLKKEGRWRWVDIMDRKVSDLIREEDVEATFRGRVALPGAERALEQKERAKLVWAIVQSLPAKYRVPLVLFNYEGMSYKEISETLGLGMSAVESRIHRAKKQLIKKLEPWIDRI